MLRADDHQPQNDDQLQNLGATEDHHFFKKQCGSSILIKLAWILMVFAAGFITGIVITLQGSTLRSKQNYNKIYQDSPQSNCTISPPLKCEGEGKNDCMNFENSIHPKGVIHGLSDQELLWRASLKPRIENYPFKRVPKVAFLFLTRGPLALLPLWEKFFVGHNQGFFSIYVHTKPGYVLELSRQSVFFGRQIPSKDVSWGDISQIDAEKRLLANALLDFSNERFVLLSESCIPVYNFPTVYKYLTESSHTFVDSYDEPTYVGRGRYDPQLSPYIGLDQWRKGAQWFEINRPLGIEIMSDSKYYDLFKEYCHLPCFPEEHYIPTYINIFHSPLNGNHSVTWVDWSFEGAHPTTFGKESITEVLLQHIRNHRDCLYNWKKTNVCYLFARKFDPSALEPLLELSSKVMGF